MTPSDRVERPTTMPTRKDSVHICPWFATPNIVRRCPSRRLTSALSGAPPLTLAKCALLIGASVLERIVRAHVAEVHK
jgi:hypothetical protein